MSHKSNQRHHKKNIILDIDYREKCIINILKNRGVFENQYNDDNNGFHFNIKNLIIGDFIFKEICQKGTQEIDIFHMEHTDSQTETQETQETQLDDVHYIVERKTVNDLCSSIKDGRFLEQKNRLIDTIDDPSKIIYIIEGDKNKISPMHNIPKSTFDSAVQNLIFKHKYKVIFTDTPEETVENIILLYKKLSNNDIESKGTFIKPVKKINKLTEQVFINMLCAIPGVSIKTAKTISYKYKNMNELIQAYNVESDYSLKCSLLSDISLCEKRKIGISLSTRIYKSLFENSQNKEKEKQNKDICLL